MKRPSQPPAPERHPSPRRRALSEEERALWDTVARQIKPLKKQRAAKTQSAPRQDASLHGPSAAGHPAPARPVAPPPAPRATRPATPPLAPLGRRERTKLSRGRSAIEARLDLHGMTQVRAHHALSNFLHRAHHDGLTFVLVITGKGRSGGESGVLRRQVPQWLSLPEFRSLVVGFEEAHIGHGGEGALYVRIRRAKA
ncbi:Smr/MutS family protein [Bradyrhizobium sp.]|uniref:Smr/MutS family protein n=1 Tax=Bradyrhizobium sp. TaxID=376 RepID=UPI0023A1942E|nr:Smr/MutS family protein [Bradyrhizobium sp.]MDE2375922.1 Smr/MutS family protein [Bradyrhizobium sp.]